MLQRMVTLTLAVALVAFSACSEEATDKINLLNQASLNPATVALDGPRPSCAKDELHQGSNQIDVDNVLSPSAECPAEIIIFADSHELKLESPVPFKDSGDDVVPVTMTSLVNVPLTVWIMFQNPTGDREREVKTEVNRATQLFDMEQCGIEFTASAINEQTTGFDFELLDADCGRLADFKNVGFDAGKINVYYIRSVQDNQGQRCVDGASDVLLIGGARKDGETLAHELGHATSLGDLKTTEGLGADNLMLSPGSERNSLSLGQCFRSTINTDSVLNRSSLRSGPTRTCPDAADSPTCPALTLKRP